MRAHENAFDLKSGMKNALKTHRFNPLTQHRMFSADFHSTIEREETPQANRLADYIASRMRPSCYLDFGCSSGIYLRAIKQRLPEIHSAGFEFSEAAIQNSVCSDIQQTDLTLPLNLEKREGTLGLCLEVLEHISDDHWRQVIENITKLSDVIIFSAAVPGQGGVGHINCRPKIDWIRRFHSLGWVVDYDRTRDIVNYMKSGYHMGWFVNNAVVFVPAA